MEIKQVIQIDKRDFSELLCNFISNTSEEKAYAKFYNVLVPASWIAKIHNVSYQTVFRYIQGGMIVPEERNSRNDHYQFRLSEVLKMDFKKLQKQLRRVSL